MKRSAFFGLVGFLALALGLTAIVPATVSAAETTKLETAWLPEHETFLVWYAKKKGWDKQEGIDLVLNRFDSGKDMMSSVSKWAEWGIGACGAFPILTSEAHKAFYVIGIGNDESSANVVMVRRDNPIMKVKGYNDGYPNLYGHPADVKGKTILCPESSSAQYLLTKWLAAYGLKPADVNVQHMDPEVALQEFLQGQGDAVVLWAPYTYMGEENGLKTAATSRTVNARQPILLFANKVFADKNPDKVAAFLRVYMRAVRMMREESVANLAADYKAYYKEWTGKELSDAEVLKDITTHPVFTLDDQIRLFDNEHAYSEVQVWLDSIIQFHAGAAYTQTKADQMLKSVTGNFLERVKRPVPDYR